MLVAGKIDDLHQQFFPKEITDEVDWAGFIDELDEKAVGGAGAGTSRDLLRRLMADLMIELKMGQAPCRVLCVFYLFIDF